MQHKEVFRILENFAPLKLALPGDNCGLQLGSLNDKTKGILVCVDVSKATIKQAIAKKANLIVSHHPIKTSDKGLQASGPLWEILKPAIKKDSTIIAMHTNYDIAHGGLNDYLCKTLELTNIQILQPTYIEKLFKLVTFVPQAALEKVRYAICSAGAGNIGNYSDCTFLSHGIGTFYAGKKTHPKSGKKGQLNRVGEARLETIIPESKLLAVVSALLKAHPYEEPAYDIYPLLNQGRVIGIGRVGMLKNKMSFQSFCNLVTKKLKPELIVPHGKGQVKKVAVSSGSGRGVIENVINSGADTFVTGELNHHARLLAMDYGINLIEAGHYDTEICFVDVVRKLFKESLYNANVYYAG